jgi:hypothetical protein
MGMIPADNQPKQEGFSTNQKKPHSSKECGTKNPVNMEYNRIEVAIPLEMGGDGMKSMPSTVSFHFGDIGMFRRFTLEIETSVGASRCHEQTSVHE